MLTRVRKCLDLLPAPLRWRWVLQIPLALCAAGLEAIGAFAVFALVRVVGDPSQSAQLPGFALLEGFGGGRRAVIAAAVIVGIFYLFKNALLMGQVALQHRVIADSTVFVSRELLRGYLSIPFVHHARRNSAELIRNCLYSGQTAFREVMEPAFAIVTEACIGLAVIIVLLVKAPVVTLTASLMLATLLTVLIGTTRRLQARWGRDEQALRTFLLQLLQQIFQGLKDIKLRGREQHYYDAFSQQQRRMARVQYLNSLVSNASRLSVETVFICGVLFVVVLTMLRDDTAGAVPLLGLYAYAGFRVIPSVNRILTYVGRMQYGAVAADQLHDEFTMFRDLIAPPSAAPTQSLAFEDRLVLDDVSFAYPTGTFALRDVSVSIRRGEAVGIVGTTGAGKSTLVDIALGLLQPSSGRVTVDGVDIQTALRSWQTKIGYVPQTVYLMDDSLRRNVAFGLPDEVIDDERVRHALQMAQLDSVIAALPEGLDTVVGERGARLSGGERQRVAIARALYHEPELLVFDEATAALDNQTEREVTRAIENLHGSKTLLVIAHRLSTVRSCDRLIVVRNGRVEAEGSYTELLERSPQFRVLVHAEVA